MPKLLHKENLLESLTIGVQVGPGTSLVPENGVWTARIKFPGNPPVFKTTSIPYGRGALTLKQMAIKKALELHAPLAQRFSRGELVGSIKGAYRVLQDYDNWIWSGVKDGKTVRVSGGRGVWNKRKYERSAYHRAYIREFLASLKRKGSVLDIRDIGPRTWNTFDDWLSSKYPILSVPSRLHTITEVRHFLFWCYEQEILESVPSIARPHRGGVAEARKRMRREISVEEYNQMVAFTRAKYLEETSPYRDYRYLFHLYILILANCGIRPPTSGLPSTLMYWKDLDFEDPSRPVINRPNEKGHSYTAILLPAAKDYVEALRRFYEEERGMPCRPQDPLFRHTEGERRGEPILNFRRQWLQMIYALGLGKPGAPQSERVSPSSLRAFFITARLYAGEVDILQLARATGTSVGQIEVRYARLDTRRSYEYLTAGAWMPTGVPQYQEIEGTKFYIGRS